MKMKNFRRRMNHPCLQGIKHRTYMCTHTIGLIRLIYTAYYMVKYISKLSRFNSLRPYSWIVAELHRPVPYFAVEFS